VRASIALAALLIVATSGLVTAFVGSTASADAPRQWSLQASDPGSGLGTFSSVSCPTASRCEAIGGRGSPAIVGGLILSSTDGGATWAIQYSPPPADQLIAITCPTTSNCIAVGDNTLLSTADGGATWIKRSPPGFENFDTVTC